MEYALLAFGSRFVIVDPIAAETGADKADVAITPLAMPMLAGPGAISTIILLDAPTEGLGQRIVLLACLAAVGLASYSPFALASHPWEPYSAT